MGPKRKSAVTSAKQSAHSKRHKSASSSASSKKRQNGQAGPAGQQRGKQGIEGSDGKVARVSGGLKGNRKDRKGKAPAFIPVVQSSRSGHASDSEAEEEEFEIDDGDEDFGGMEVDDELQDFGGAGFLTKLDEKGISASRPSLLEAHRKEKPKAPPRKSTLASVSMPAPAPLKSEIKAQKKKEALKKKRRKLGLPSDEEEGEDMVDEDAPPSRKPHPEGELLDDLESDDLAFGSGSESDELSVMSSFDGDEDMSDMSDMSDLASDFDEDDEDLEDDEVFADGGEEPAFDDDEELGWQDGDDESEEGIQDSEDDDTQDSAEDASENDISDESDGSDVSSGSEGADSDAGPRRKRQRPVDDEGDDLEAAYENRPAKPKAPKPRPTKLPVIENGRVVRAASPLDRSPSPDIESSPEPEPRKREAEYRSDPLGQRFGRPAIRQLLEIRDKKQRIARAREEIADLGKEASGIGEGEGGLNLVKRLLSLTAPKFSSSVSARNAGEKPIMVDKEIRILAMVSLLAVFNDIVPMYRIRALTEAEKETKVSQQVARQREWEEGLVSSYKRFLELCEAEVTDDSPLAPAAIHCLCTLVKEKSDFNFAVNIMDVIVKRLGRKGWDDGHQMCLETVSHIFIHDTTTTASNSLHLVRLISRLVRARSFAVRPEVISSLLNLRLRDELGGGRIRASANAIFKEQAGAKGAIKWNKEKNHKGRKGGKAKSAMDKKGSKKARMAAKEQEKIDKELREAEGEINRDERERNMTETLKLLFALYFRILKLDYRSPLLPAALEGLARFAHLVNIDFFRDLLEVLKGIIKRGETVDAEEVEIDVDEVPGQTKRNDMREKLLCIVTAFELLQGQGEALNIDLGDFVSALYALILPLSLSPTFEETPYLGRNAIAYSNKILNKLAQTEADLLFRALSAVFLTPRSLPSSTRTMAFSKRLLTASLNWPPASQLRTLVFLRSLLIREPKLEAMLETGDRRVDGKWRGTVDDPERAEPESTSWWEGAVFLRNHPDDKVRAEAKKVMNYVKD